MSDLFDKYPELRNTSPKPPDFHDQLRLASNPATLPDKLHDILQTAVPHQPIIIASHGMTMRETQSQRQELRRVLARNPNLSKEDLLRLVYWEPEDVMANPAMLMLVLEDPSFGHALLNNAMHTRKHIVKAALEYLNKQEGLLPSRRQSLREVAEQLIVEAYNPT